MKLSAFPISIVISCSLAVACAPQDDGIRSAGRTPVEDPVEMLPGHGTRGPSTNPFPATEEQEEGSGEDELEGCSKDPPGAGDMLITTRVVWTAQTLSIAGRLHISTGGELVLENTTLSFDPVSEDGETLCIDGDGRLTATGSTLLSNSGQTWALDVWDTGKVSLSDANATEHGGLRAHGESAIVASGASDVEELQVYDDALLRVENGAAAYVVLYFGGEVNAVLTAGELASGEALTRTFDVPTSEETTGHIELDNAEIYGWQVDLEESAKLELAGGSDIVLGLHVEELAQTIDTNITADAPSTGAFDLSAGGGPTFVFRDSTIVSMNIYVEGASDVVLSGANDVTEPNAGGTSKLTLGPATRLAADSAQAYEQAQLVIDGVTLYEDAEGGSAPSFVAYDTAVLSILGVAATAGTRVYVEGEAKVMIEDGSGWTADKFEAYELAGEGGIYVDGVKVM